MEKEKNKVAFVSVLSAIFLTCFKLVIGLITGSLGILSEALHSGLDLVAAVITLFAVKVSNKPSDEDHHYVHGKIENFSALIETLLLFITCFWIIYEAAHRIASGKGLTLSTTETIFSFIVVSTSILIDAWRSKKLMIIAKKYKSQALEADALHFSTDIWSSSVVLLGLIFVKIYEWTHLPIFFYADSVAALVVAIIVIHICWSLGKKAIDALLDKAPIKESEDIKEIIINFPDVINYHDLRVRNSGHLLFVEATIHVVPTLCLIEAHNISDNLEKRIIKYDEYAIVSIHVEPDKHKK
jgi:cation diffusion facilitator family transporter